FFFQAEDGIRDGHVIGVQTCALPISAKRNLEIAQQRRAMQKKSDRGDQGGNSTQPPQQKSKPETREEQQPKSDANTEALLRSVRSEERRVGKGQSGDSAAD